MIRISQLKLPCGHSEGALEEKIRKTLRTGSRNLSFTIVRHSIDARKKPLLLDIFTVDVDTGMKPAEEQSLIRRLKNKNIASSPVSVYRFPDSGSEILSHRPVIIGAGPAGLFCALFLSEHGYRPIVIERGSKMEERTADVLRYWETGVQDPLSNVQFGEGGAGTFSDGKLNTQINDKTGRSNEVLRIFARNGAPESILYESKPHIGTDRLREVIPRIRRKIEAAGGQVRFNTVCTGFVFDHAKPEAAGPAGAAGASDLPGSDHVRRLKGIYIQKSWDKAGDPVFLPADAVVLAIGHSARDTMEEIFREGIPMEQKQFAVGFRVAHPQSVIDESQYGISDPSRIASLGLSASPYKVTARASSGRGVYSFCMCPGGYIVNASSEEGHVCVNGMSDEKRDSGWANSAIVITVGQEEFGSSDVLAGMRFQRSLEKKAFLMGKGAVPVQTYTGFREGFRALSRAGEMSAPDLQNDPADGLSDSFSENPSHNILDSPRDSFSAPWAKGSCVNAPLHTLLPEDLTSDFIEGMEQFGRKIHGFDGPQAIVAGIESRTSSPVRITRGSTLESTGAAGLYPCGEGAGYAGGIMSAAMDGMRVAEAIASRFAPVPQ